MKTTTTTKTKARETLEKVARLVATLETEHDEDERHEAAKWLSRVARALEPTDDDRRLEVLAEVKRYAFAVAPEHCLEGFGDATMRDPETDEIVARLNGETQRESSSRRKRERSLQMPSAAAAREAEKNLEMRGLLARSTAKTGVVRKAIVDLIDATRAAGTGGSVAYRDRDREDETKTISKDEATQKLLGHLGLARSEPRRVRQKRKTKPLTKRSI